MRSLHPSVPVLRRGPLAWFGRSLDGKAATWVLLALLVPLEPAGRLTTTEGQDAALVAALAGWVLLVRLRHGRAPLPWVDGLLARLGRLRTRLHSLDAEPGIDLRGGPPLPPGFPPLLGGAVLVSLLPAMAALVPGWDLLAASEVLQPVSGLLRIALLGALWTALVPASLFLLFIAFALAHDELVRHHRGPGPRTRRLEHTLAVVLPAGCVLAAFALPAGASVLPAIAVLALVTLALATPGAPDATVLWRRRSGGPLRSIGWNSQTLAATSVLAFAGASVALLAGGSPLAPPGRGAEVAARLPLSTALAAFLGWAAASATVSWGALLLRTSLEARFRDPARRRVPRLRVLPPLDPSLRRDLRTLGREAGFRVEFGEETPRSPAVPLRVAVDAPPPDPWATPSGPPLLRPADLTDGETLRRLRRREVLRQRRLLLRGLESIFKVARARRYSRGCGFWVAPHLWFTLGLSRDVDEESHDSPDSTYLLETIGPAWSRLLPLEARSHLHEVLRDLELDLLFVEDGVTFPRLRGVLRRAFELHDRYDGARRAEDHRFNGLPGVRVLIHDFDLEKAGGGPSKEYPEPDYDTLGRARILHVYRDRGASEETVDAPRDRKDAPVLV